MRRLGVANGDNNNDPLTKLKIDQDRLEASKTNSSGTKIPNNKNSQLSMTTILSTCSVYQTSNYVNKHQITSLILCTCVLYVQVPAM